jgi:phage terminase large subunit-like protein
MVSLSSMGEQLAATLDPYRYLRSLGWDAYEWQREVLRPKIPRLILLCPRQSGKSTVVAAKVTHQAKYFPNSLIMLFAPTQDQAEELMQKISEFMTQDRDIILIRDSSETKKLINGSRIKAFTASPKSARGYSDPDMIIFDESAQIDRELYLTVRPMMTGGKTDLILLSTPYGRDGFFYDTWHKENSWTKVQVKPPDVLHEMAPEKHQPFDLATWQQACARVGVKAYMSPRHQKEFLKEEYQEMGDHWYRQEYNCEFLDPLDNVFNLDDVMSAFASGDSYAALNMDYADVPVEEGETALWG